MMFWLVVGPAALLLLVIGVGLLFWSAQEAKEAGLGFPANYRVVYSDSGGWEKVEKSLRSHKYMLSGKPDYILRTRQGPVPVEVKPTRRAEQPYESDLMQLAAYCLLVEEDWGQPPAYGLLRYAEKTFRVEWDETLRARLFQTLIQMRELEQIPASLGCTLPDPGHDMTVRCRNCGFSYVCWPNREQ